MAEAYVALQTQHMLLLKDVTHEPIALVNMEPAILLGNDPGGVLAAVLQHRQRVVDRLVDGLVSNDTDNSTHDLFNPT